MRRLQLVLRTHHSLALLLPFNYCILSYSLVFCCALHTFLLPFSVCFHMPLPLIVSPSPQLDRFFLGQNFFGGAADVRITGPAACCSTDTQTQRHGNLWDLWSYVHSLHAGGCKWPSEEDKRRCEGVACEALCSCVCVCVTSMLTVDCWTL